MVSRSIRESISLGLRIGGFGSALLGIGGICQLVLHYILGVLFLAKLESVRHYSTSPATLFTDSRSISATTMSAPSSAGFFPSQALSVTKPMLFWFCLLMYYRLSYRAFELRKKVASMVKLAAYGLGVDLLPGGDRHEP